MLSLEKPLVVDGITVYRDHADKSRFWYLPGRVALARRTDGAPSLSLLTYRPAKPGEAQRGGGFMMFESTLELPPSTLSKIEARVSAEPGVQLPISLSPPPFENGAVQCIALDLQGSGGTSATPATEGAIRVTEQILGATVPTMDAANRAAFNLVLSQEGAIIMEHALKESVTPVGVVYSLQYLAMRPALDVTITAHLEQIYNGLTVGLEGQYLYFKANLEAAMEWLRAKGAITIDVKNFTDEQDEKDQEKWALQFFTDHLLNDWFTPTLAPGKVAGADDGKTPKPGGGDQGAKTDPPKDKPEPSSGGEKPAPGGSKPAEPEQKPASGGGTPATGSGTPATGSGTPATGSGTPATGGGATPPKPAAAVLEMQSATPAPLPAGYAVAHTPAATGTTETLRVTGAGARVRVAGQETPLTADGALSRDVAPGETLPVSVTWDATANTEVFCLFFDMDKPAESGWSTQPPNAEFRGYVENTTNDPRFARATGIQQMEGDGAWTGPELGAERLSRWIAQLPAPKNVEVRGYASHEHALPKTDDARAAYNLRLSRRRLEVAVALVRRAGGNPVVQEALGDTVAAARPGSHSHFGGDPDNRVAQIRLAGGGTGPSWTGVLKRAATPAPVEPKPEPKPEPTEPKKTEPEKPDPKKTEPKKTEPKPGELPTLAAFKLRFVHQDERRELTLRYQRSEAVRRTLAPQGFLGLLAADLTAAEKAVTFVDLDHAFFRELTVTASMPGDVSDLGLLEAHLSIDYGPANHVRHGDLVFTPQQTAPQSFTTFLDDKLTLSYNAQLILTFDATKGWAADALRYSIPLRDSTARDVVVNPYEHLDLTSYTIEPGNIDWDVVDSIDVQLAAQGYGERELRHLVTLRRDTPAQVWRLRGALPAPAGRGVTVSYRQTLTDGSVERTEPVPVDLPLIRVDDLFTDALNLVLTPAFVPAGIDRVIVDIAYRSEQPVPYERTLRYELPGADTEPLRVRIALRDPAQRDYRVRFTFIGPGLFDQRAFLTTSEEVLPIR